jgi:hypothetical protein
MGKAGWETWVLIQTFGRRDQSETTNLTIRCIDCCYPYLKIQYKLGEELEACFNLRLAYQEQ